MPLKKHHKIMIGSLSSFLVILLIANSIFLYVLYGQLQINYSKLNTNINELKVDTQSKFNELTENVMETQQDVTNLNIQLGSINEGFSTLGEQFSKLKSSVGEDFSSIIENAVKSVVTIKTDVGQGTGFIITNDGYVVTNAHVLSGGRIVQAMDYEQNIIQASFIGYNSDLDIALLKIPGTHERFKLADSDDIQIGEKVIAIGNPLGLQFSVSQGIVSAVHRPGPNGLEAYIQTDAALNPGSSGGPLINTDGKVIGINNFKIGTGESLGFALESNFIKDAVNEIAKQALGETLV
ncbi:MAG: S1C family serine protease [Nanoarchaeota archaeon]|nr:S1C family serine protease [Nanoarchaeota archaeon]